MNGASFSPHGLLTLEVPSVTPDRLFQLLHKILDEVRS